MSTNSRTFQHLQQSIRTHSFRIQYHSGTVSTKTLPKCHLWAASRTVCHSPLVYSPCWRDIPPREFANYLPDPDPEQLSYRLTLFIVHTWQCYYICELPHRQVTHSDVIGARGGLQFCRPKSREIRIRQIREDLKALKCPAHSHMNQLHESNL